MKKVGNMMKKIVVNLMIVALAGGPAWAGRTQAAGVGACRTASGLPATVRGGAPAHRTPSGRARATPTPMVEVRLTTQEGDKPHERLLRTTSGAYGHGAVHTGPYGRTATSAGYNHYYGGHTPLSIRPSL